jgi:hypothetical protein
MLEDRILKVGRSWTYIKEATVEELEEENKVRDGKARSGWRSRDESRAVHRACSDDGHHAEDDKGELEPEKKSERKN